MKQKNSYNYQDLIDCGNGILFGEGNAKLPLPPMLMFDRITKIENSSGTFKRGYLEAELDIKDDLWFFKCHFQKRSGDARVSWVRRNVATGWFLSWLDR